MLELNCRSIPVEKTLGYISETKLKKDLATPDKVRCCFLQCSFRSGVRSNVALQPAGGASSRAGRTSFVLKC
jgi:hypothetical protein